MHRLVTLTLRLARREWSFFLVAALTLAVSIAARGHFFDSHPIDNSDYFTGESFTIPADGSGNAFVFSDIVVTQKDGHPGALTFGESGTCFIASLDETASYTYMAGYHYAGATLQIFGSNDDVWLLAIHHGQIPTFGRKTFAVIGSNRSRFAKRLGNQPRVFFGTL